MTKTIKIKKQKRLAQIEDRKIEILLEIGSFNGHYDDKILQLNTEYELLHEEYYNLKVELIKRKRKV